jgi:hypothetical protein
MKAGSSFNPFANLPSRTGNENQRLNCDIEDETRLGDGWQVSTLNYIYSINGIFLLYKKSKIFTKCPVTYFRIHLALSLLK